MAPINDYDLLPALRLVEDRIWAKVQRTDDFTCWLWTGAPAAHGYGQVGLSLGLPRKRWMRSHRAVFMLFHGRPIEHGKLLDHVCRNVACVNPHHLHEVTHAQNSQSGIRSLNRGKASRIRMRQDDAGNPRYNVLFTQYGDGGEMRQRSRTFGTERMAESFRAHLADGGRADHFMVTDDEAEYVLASVHA